LLCGRQHRIGVGVPDPLQGLPRPLQSGPEITVGVEVAGVGVPVGLNAGRHQPGAGRRLPVGPQPARLGKLGDHPPAQPGRLFGSRREPPVVLGQPHVLAERPQVPAVAHERVAGGHEPLGPVAAERVVERPPGIVEVPPVLHPTDRRVALAVDRRQVAVSRNPRCDQRALPLVAGGHQHVGLIGTDDVGQPDVRQLDPHRRRHDRLPVALEAVEQAPGVC